MKAGLAAAVLVVGLGACSPAASSVPEGALRYVALGDSYTIGTSVSAAESWPSQLVARVLCVATPDYTVTPQGAAFGSPEQQRAGVEQVNAVLAEACAARDIGFVPEIFAISKAAASDQSLLAGDGLHPSGAQYTLWVDAIQPVVDDLLGE